MEDKRLWKVNGKLIGMDKDIQPVSVDTNDEDTVFVCDKANACLQEDEPTVWNPMSLADLCKREISSHVTA